MTPQDDRRVDELREQLRALGYLDARVDRFVLGGGRRQGPRALALGASARIGLLTGVLLGPAAVVGLRMRVPGLVTSVADALVLTAYLTVLFALATAVLAGFGVIVGSVVVRQAGPGPAATRRLAAATGLGVTAACFIYLVVWWRSADPASDLDVMATSAVLAVAAGISLLLGHGVTVTVLAWLARSGVGPALTPGLPLSSRRAIAALGLAGIVAGVAALAATRAPAAQPPTLVVAPTGERVLVLSIDGVDPDTLRRLAAGGRLPNLWPLFRTSVATMASSEHRDPARVWTTIATGQPVERHGIAGLESRQVAGVDGRFRPDSRVWASLTAATDLLRLTRPAVATGGERLAPTFWEVAARAGLRTAVLHWWATWPASPDQGIVLTDRALLRLEHGGDLDGEIAPASLYATLREDWTARRLRATRMVDDALPAATGTGGASDVIRRAATIDATLIDLATDPALGPLDLLALYLPGLDIVQHTLLGDDAGSLTPSAAADRLAAVERYYEFLDSALANLLAPAADAGTATLVIGITQPGRISTPADGLLGLRGTAAGETAAEGEPTAIAATILYALGVPVAADLARGPQTSLFAERFRTAHEIGRVSTYGPVRVTPRSSDGRTLDREMIERMRSLGYLR